MDSPDSPVIDLADQSQTPKTVKQQGNRRLSATGRGALHRPAAGAATYRKWWHWMRLGAARDISEWTNGEAPSRRGFLLGQ